MSRTLPKPYKEIGNEILPRIIAKCFGEGAELVSWNRESFMEAGENYLGAIREINCKVSFQGKQFEITFIVKLNPRRKLELFQKMTQSFFVKEGRFYSEILPLLNSTLNACNIKRFSTPKCYHVGLKLDEETILLEDLRKSGYKMESRLKPLSSSHLINVFKELAKLHAAGYLFLRKKSAHDIESELGYMEDSWLHPENDGASQYIAYANTRFTSVVYALKGIKGYEKVQTWLEKNEKNLFTDFVDGWESSSEQFRTICHGDLWSNNILFRVNDEGVVERACLIDLQQVRIASLVTDIHILLITSADGTTRAENIDEFLQIYYDMYFNIITNSGKRVPFTLQELKAEYFSKAIFSFLSGIIRLPLILSESDEVYDFNSLDAESFAGFLEFQKKQASNLLQDAKRRQRLLSIFDTAIKIGVFD